MSLIIWAVVSAVILLHIMTGYIAIVVHDLNSPWGWYEPFKPGHTEVPTPLVFYIPEKATGIRFIDSTKEVGK